MAVYMQVVNDSNRETILWWLFGIGVIIGLLVFAFFLIRDLIRFARNAYKDRQQLLIAFVGSWAVLSLIVWLFIGNEREYYGWAAFISMIVAVGWVALINMP